MLEPVFLSYIFFQDFFLHLMEFGKNNWLTFPIFCFLPGKVKKLFSVLSDLLGVRFGACLLLSGELKFRYDPCKKIQEASQTVSC